MSVSEFSKISREDIYEKVWSTPGTKLSEELGVSDVAIAKRCRKLNVPRPPRGYWAKLEAGHRQKKPALPPTPEEVFVQEAGKPMGRRLSLPPEARALHPLAEEFLKALQSSKLSYDKKRVHLRERALPDADISKEIALQAAKAFHALLQTTEARGIKFARSQSQYDGGHFRRGHDRLFFKIEEELVDKPAETVGRRRSYYSSHEANKVPSGKLSFTIYSERYGSSKIRQRWTEGEKASLETILADTATFICDHFIEVQKRREAEEIEREKQRIESEIRWKKHQEEESIRKQEEAKVKHAQSIEAAAQHRKDDLARAAEWWRLYQSAVAFIAECEKRWSESQMGEMTEEQQEWLGWARATAKGLSPFESGYPEPSVDGAFDPKIVPFGGPYPATREFPEPPTMPTIPAPVIVPQTYGEPNYQAPAPKPFPFWLKYQRR